MSWNVVFTFVNTREQLPDETTLMSTLPNTGNIVWTTPGFLDAGSSDDWKDAISWEVMKVDIFLESRKSTALITLRPHVR